MRMCTGKMGRFHGYAGGHGTHQFAWPLSNCVRPATKPEVGKLMVGVFLVYRVLARSLCKMVFNVVITLDDKDAAGNYKRVHHEHRFSQAEADQLAQWLFFACNSCMHQKMYDDYFRKYASKP